MSKSQPMIFFGTEAFSAVILEALLDAGFNIKAVVTKPDFKKGRGQKISQPLVKQIALKHGIEVWQPKILNEITQQFISENCDFAVLAAYGKLIPARTLNLFKGGIINVHPSLLPRWRGPSPIEAAILAGDKETGVSIIKLVEKMDAGPVYVQESIELDGSETAPLLYERLAKLGAKLLVENLPNITAGSLLPKTQDESLATYSKMIKKEDGSLDFINKSADQLESEIRAYLEWPKSHAKLGQTEVIITEAHALPSGGTPGEIENVDNQALILYCQEGYLCVDKIQPVGGREMNITEFLAGYNTKILS